MSTKPRGNIKNICSDSSQEFPQPSTPPSKHQGNRFYQPVALVTGAGDPDRIGASLVDFLLQKGFRVAVHYNQDEKGAKKLVEKARHRGISSEKIRIFQANFLNTQAAAKVFEDVIKWADGPITCLINNASWFGFDTAEKQDDKILRDCLKVNAVAVEHLSQLVLRQRSTSKVFVVTMLDGSLYQKNRFASFRASCAERTAWVERLAQDYRQHAVHGLVLGHTLKSKNQSEEAFQQQVDHAGHRTSIESIKKALGAILDYPSEQPVRIFLNEPEGTLITAAMLEHIVPDNSRK